MVTRAHGTDQVCDADEACIGELGDGCFGVAHECDAMAA
ncbi:hypothetical protein GGE06_005259 [Streptomyces sp. SFB5A]|jgi:hypothetical protein|uniref:Uncharacterized protein n=1 Tax=Streptomyces nymphaeiformis TaxID=2663842 RepID=A0A7W7U3P9_9ACTN|nr:hypothetical protein [Streptomyces nymphaeiformis]